jgi:fatty-acyl-CoA synthase
LRALLALYRYGPTLATGYFAAAARYPGARALTDELGALTFEQVEQRTNALARGLGSSGITEGDGVAILCRNHRGFVEASIACSKLGAHALYLNTAFAGPQITEVVERERPTAIVYDEEFAEHVAAAAAGCRAFVAWSEGAEGTTAAHPTLADLISGHSSERLPAPSEAGRTVILTSGTTGSPKGASRATPHSITPAAAVLSRIPLRARETTMIASPMFHSWGLAHLVLATVLSSGIVLRRRFDPEETLRALQESRATALIVVPVMLQRILELGEETIKRCDTSSLRVIASSGSALPGPLAQRVMDTFGDKLYNLYGSTEAAWATIATPRELREAPGTAGRPPRGTTVKILGQDWQELPTGDSGLIFVGNEALFEGYTGGGDKQRLGELMATGDVGHFDDEGRLFVDGRDDDMIVSGGENVYPAEVEDLLAHVEGVREVAVIGVPDDQFGQRLRAFVALDPRAAWTEDELRDHVKRSLAAYKVPREIRFLDALPRNATGKVLKRELG